MSMVIGRCGIRVETTKEKFYVHQGIRALNVFSYFIMKRLEKIAMHFLFILACLGVRFFSNYIRMGAQ